MNQKFTPIFFLLLTFFSCQSSAQTFVGEVLYRNSYKYAKIKCKGDSCEFSLPYIDGNNKYPFLGNPTVQSTWEVQRGVEKWEFDLISEEGVLTGEVRTDMGKQLIVMRQQLKAVKKEKWSDYLGVYADANQRKASIITPFNTIDLVSPYTEETVILKPIGEHTFWSISGEKSRFLDYKNGAFQTLEISDRFGNKHLLKRQAPIEVTELLIPIGEDTLYAQLYLPRTTGKVPACLILPGGGPTGIDNYVFEARFLAAYGLATLVFDKAGNGQSKGKTHFTQQTFEDKNDQYIALFHYLANHPKVDASKVGVHGPSEGGRLALMMAIDLKEEMAFANAVAAPLMTMREGQFFAMDQHHRMLGIDEVDNMNIQQIWSDYYDEILHGEIKSATIEKANKYRPISNRIFLPPNFTQIPTSPKKEDIINKRVLTEATEITCPILFQYGENDQRVSGPKSLQNFLPRMTAKHDIKTLIYPRGSHSMMTPEYKICPGYMDDKIKWLKRIGIL